MKESAQVLFKLLRIALGSESDLSLPSSVDWKEVIDLSFEQGVAALAVDGLQRIYDGIENRDSKEGIESLEALDSPELEDLKYEWFGEVMNCEQDYASSWSSAKQLAQLYAKNNIRTVVLKGFSVSRYYLIPQHRSFSDLDCFLFENYEKGNKVVESEGVEVKRHFYKHSKFTYKGLVVENHHFCTGVRGSEKAKCLERYLQKIMVEEEPSYIGDSSLEYTSPMFTAMFSLVHTLQHFLSEGICLKHICDWAMILKQEEVNIDWKDFESKCCEFGLLQFAQSMTRLAGHVCGVRIEWLPSTDLQLQDERLLEDMFQMGDREHIAGHIWQERLAIVKKTLTSGWKYKAFTDRTVLGDLWVLITGFLFDRKPSLL